MVESSWWQETQDTEAQEVTNHNGEVMPKYILSYIAEGRIYQPEFEASGDAMAKVKAFEIEEEVRKKTSDVSKFTLHRVIE